MSDTPTTKDFMSTTGALITGPGGDFAAGGMYGDWSSNNTNWSDSSDDYSTNGVIQVPNSEKPYSPLPGGGQSTTTATTNAFVHDNATVEADQPIKFQPNVLDNFDQYTYHWKLFITSLENSYNGAFLSLDNQTIIAESAVTDLTIDKVEFEGIPVPSVTAGTGTMTTIKFEITEPSGAGLIDKMYYQAIALGIGNWTVMPFYIQLEFRARDPETSNSLQSFDGINSGGIAGLRWVWPLKITDMKAHVTHVGTRYEFQAVYFDEYTQSNTNFAIQSNMILERLNTFGDAMKALESKLNADEYEKLVANYTIPDSYKIVVDPELIGQTLLSPKEGQSTAWGKDFLDFNKKTATYNAGTGIDKIIDSLLGSIGELQEAVEGSNTPGGKPNTAKTEKTQMKKLWRVITECRPFAFDYSRQDNAVEHTIYIVKYDIGVLYANATQVGATPETAEASRNRMLEYVKNKILCKKYDYIYTGLNDQILNFDLNLNFAFASVLARYDGLYSDGFTQTPGITVTKDKIDKQKQVVETVRKVIRFINSTPPDKLDENQMSAMIQNAQVDVGNSTLDSETQQRLIILLQNAKPANRQTYIADLKAKNVAAARQYANALANPTNLTNANGGVIGSPTFMSDVDISSADSKKAQENMISSLVTRSTKLHPVAFREGVQENNLKMGTDPASDNGRARTSSMFATALYSASGDANLVQVKLSIKGDPYWIFPKTDINPSTGNYLYKTDLDTDQAIKTIKTRSVEEVNTNTSDNYIIIRFRTPRMFNNDTGLYRDPTTADNYSEVETFSGVYRVVGINNKFENGKFIQELNCILDNSINLSLFLTDIEIASGKDSGIINIGPSDSVSGIAIPETAIKNHSVLQPDTEGVLGAGVSGSVYDLTPLGAIPVSPNPTVEGE